MMEGRRVLGSCNWAKLLALLVFVSASRGAKSSPQDQATRGVLDTVEALQTERWGHSRTTTMPAVPEKSESEDGESGTTLKDVTRSAGSESSVSEVVEEDTTSTSTSTTSDMIIEPKKQQASGTGATVAGPPDVQKHSTDAPQDLKVETVQATLGDEAAEGENVASVEPVTEGGGYPNQLKQGNAKSSHQESGRFYVKVTETKAGSERSKSWVVAPVCHMKDKNHVHVFTCSGDGASFVASTYHLDTIAEIDTGDLCKRKGLSYKSVTSIAKSSGFDTVSLDEGTELIFECEKVVDDHPDSNYALSDDYAVIATNFKVRNCRGGAKNAKDQKALAPNSCQKLDEAKSRKVYCNPGAYDKVYIADYDNTDCSGSPTIGRAVSINSGECVQDTQYHCTKLADWGGVHPYTATPPNSGASTTSVVEALMAVVVGLAAMLLYR